MLLRRLLRDGALEIGIDRAGELVQPPPILGDRLENDGMALPPDLHFRSVETELLGQPHRLRAAGPEISAMLIFGPLNYI